MNRDVRVEPLLERMLAETLTSRAPDRLRADIASATSRKRQRPPWLTSLKEPPMRYRSQLVVGSPTLRLAVVLAVTTALLLTLAGAVIAGASLLPSPVPRTAVDPCTTPVTRVTGHIEWGFEQPGRQQFERETGVHVRHFTFVSKMVMDDDRLNGETTGSGAWDAGESGGILRGHRVIENAAGRWEGPEIAITKLNESGVGGLLPDDSPRFVDAMDLVGSGAYEGLSATLFMDTDVLVGDVPVVEGSIWPTEIATCDFAAQQ